MDIDTKLLRAFVAAAEEGAVTRAAARLWLAQPALSRQLARLEQIVGATLLTRNRHGVELTPEGMALLPAARDTLEAWDVAQRRVRAASRATLPQIVIGFLASPANELINPIVQRFAALRPNWRVELAQSDWSDPTAGLAAGTVDVALLRLPIPQVTGLRIERLFDEPLVVAMPAGHRLAAFKSLTIDDVLDEPFVATRGPVAWRDWWLGADQRRGRTPLIGALVGTPDEWVQAILSGAGISLAFESATRFYAPPGMAYRPISGVPPSTVGVAHLHDAHSDVIEDFVQACLETVAKA